MKEYTTFPMGYNLHIAATVKTWHKVRETYRAPHIGEELSFNIFTFRVKKICQSVDSFSETVRNGIGDPLDTVFADLEISSLTTESQIQHLETKLLEEGWTFKVG